MHWAEKYIGMPYKKGAYGPDCFDCWGLLWWVYTYDFNIPLDPHQGVISSAPVTKTRALISGIKTGSWVKLTHPIDKCGVALSKNKRVHHVGLYSEIDSGLLIHAGDGDRVIAQPVNRLKTFGWSTVEFYMHRDLICQ